MMIEALTSHRQLLWQFTRRQIEQRHRGSVLGVLWTVLQPLMLMSVYATVFGVIFKGRYAGQQSESPMEYALGVFLSIVIFQTVSESLSTSSSAVLGQPNLVKKVVFPVEILPLANLGAALFQLGVNLLLVAVALSLLGPGLELRSLLFLVVLLPILPLMLGIAFLLSALGVFIRDIQHVVGPVSLVLLNSSAVFFSTSMVPPALWEWLRFNPIVHIIEQSRAVLLFHQPVQWSHLAYSLAFGLVLAIAGWQAFKRLKPAFADVL
jgi:lipopolysaccharide transport system permease protein